MKVLNFNKKGKVDVMECWNNFADECEAKDRREKFWRLLLTALAAAAIALGSYCVGLSHSQAETKAAHRTADKALQEMDRTENKLALIRENLPWFLEIAEQIQRAELEIEVENNQKRRKS